MAVSPYLQRCEMQSDGTTCDVNVTAYKWFASWVSEIAGTFLFVFMIMVCTDKKTQFSEDKVINCFIMASSYVSSRLFSGGQQVTIHYAAKNEVINGVQTRADGGIPVGPLLNPALAFGQDLLSWYWADVQYLLAPFLGAAISLVFYEFVFVKSQEYLHEGSEDDNKELHLQEGEGKGRHDVKHINDEINSQN